MKYFIAFAILAVASATYQKPTALNAEMSEINEIIAAIQSPSTDPATAAALEQMLLDVLGIQDAIQVGPAIVDQTPIVIGPAIVDQSPISVGPAIVDFPLPEGAIPEQPAVVAPVMPTPVVPAPTSSAPLVQIIVNIDQTESAVAGSPVIVAPVMPTPVLPTPVQVAEQPEINPTPVQIVELPEVMPTPVQVVDEVIPVETVNVASPIFPAPAVVLPEILN